jgi:hypothetical protein
MDDIILGDVYLTKLVSIVLYWLVESYYGGIEGNWHGPSI